MTPTVFRTRRLGQAEWVNLVADLAKPPTNLTPVMRRFWRDVLRDYRLEPHHLLLLESACRAWDRAEQARKSIESDGILLEGRYGKRQNPAVVVERDAKNLFKSCLIQLGLDLEQPTTPRAASRWRGR
jgi:phage terminase small subunit